MAVGFVVLFAGIPEGLIRAASLVLNTFRATRRSGEWRPQSTDVGAGRDIVSRQLEASAMIERTATRDEPSMEWFYEDKAGYKGPTSYRRILVTEGVRRQR